MRCPWCESEKVFAEFGNHEGRDVQLTPYECHACGARQINPLSGIKVSVEEKVRGWHTGWSEQDVLASPPSAKRVRCIDCELMGLEASAMRKKLRDQEAQFLAAHKEFQRVAADITATNGQMRRSLENAHQDLEEARAMESVRVQEIMRGERTLAEEQRQGLLRRIEGLETELARERGQKAAEKAKKEEPVVEGTRFSLLEVD